MSQARYRISRITIQGFRGFTNPQTIAIGGKSAFVFGVNGQGKSSIIEAIRWGLFGSITGQDIEVRNTFYPQAECAVAIELTSADGPIEIRRELRPGTNLSRQTIRDAAGNTVLEKQVLPQLARIGHQEGTQVIFAAQHAAGRQAQVDITNFTRVLCFYLRLEKAPELIDTLDTLTEERSGEYTDLAKQLEAAEGKIRVELQQTQTRIEEILRNPPWGEGAAPSGSETQAKIEVFLGDAARTKGTSPPKQQASALEALSHLKHELDRLGAQSVSGLQSRLAAISSRRQTAEAAASTLLVERASQAAITQEIKSLNTRRASVLNGETTGTLHSRIAALERSMTGNAAMADLAAQAKKLCAEYGWSRCPVCGTDHASTQPADSLKERIEAEIRTLAGAVQDTTALDDLRKRVKEIATTGESLGTKAQMLEAAKNAAENAAAQLVSTLPGIGEPVDTTEIRTKIEELRRDAEELTRQMGDSQGDRTVWAKRVKDLEQELIFHKFRDETERLKTRLTDGLDGARNVLRQYQDLLTTTTSLRDMLQRAFTQAIDRAVPPLERMLTEVYQRLTRQPSYDQVRIIKPPEQPRRRELRVAATRLPGSSFPPNVLNGQAAKALRLVPYFVFSKFQPEIMELDLLLIDDPSESFDTSHISDLVGELALAAEHAQLFIATHEREKFAPDLAKHFNTDTLMEINVEGFSTTEGPKLACQ
jgi:DNA repair exonuclease SbcCD ATPase subunit